MNSDELQEKLLEELPYFSREHRPQIFMALAIMSLGDAVVELGKSIKDGLEANAYRP